jgi:hypothetical protein
VLVVCVEAAGKYCFGRLISAPISSVPTTTTTTITTTTFPASITSSYSLYFRLLSTTESTTRSDTCVFEGVSSEIRLESPSMGVLSIDKCDDECVPPHLRRLRSTPTFLFSSLPFIITFSVIFIVVLHRLFPALCGAGTRHHSPEGRVRKRIAAIAFSTTLGATGVLAELILCEVSDWGNSDVRRLAFRVVVSMLLICLILVIPLLELHSLVEATRVSRWKAKSQVAFVTVGFGTWLWVFWTLGDRLPIRGAEMKMWLNCKSFFVV